LITDAYNNFLPPLLPLLIQKMNLSLTLAGSLVTIRAIASFFTQPAVGYISERTGMRLFVLFGPLVTGVFIGLLGIAPSYWFLAICLILAGIGHSALHPQGAAMIGDIGRRRAGFFMSVWMIGGTSGMAIGPLIVTVVVSIFGLTGTVYTIVLAMVITIFLVRLAPAPSLRNADDAYSLRTHLFPKMGSLVLLWLLVVIRSATGMSFLNFLSVLLIQKGFPLLTSGFAVSLYTGGGALGGFIGGTLSDYVGRKKVILASFLLSPVVLLLFLKSQGILSLVLLIIGGIFMWGTTPVLIVAAQEIAPESRTLVSSMMMGLGWGVGAILVTVTGLLGDTIGLERALQWILILPLIGIALIVFGVKDQRGYRDSP
jgi:FSR family fosmidomycin resistance protein-like MFS transporter